MYAQVVRIQIQPGKMNEGVAIFRDSVLPAARQQKGFKNAYLLIDRKADKAIGFSLWDSEADVVAVAESGFYQEQVAKFGVVFAGPPEREVYEVTVQS